MELEDQNFLDLWPSPLGPGDAWFQIAEDGLMNRAVRVAADSREPDMRVVASGGD